MPEEAQPKRAKRSDAGTARRTARDAELMEWMAHMYGIPMDLLQHHLNVTEERARQIVRRWEQAGWVKRDYVDAGSAWVWPTKATTDQFLGWNAREWKPRPTTAAHTRAVAAVRARRTGFALDRWESERSLWHEHGWRLKDEEYPHMPDGVEILENGNRVLIEVELTAKARTRYLSKERESGTGGVNLHDGLLPEIQRRARDLNCSGIAYWCSPVALPVIEDVTKEYSVRSEIQMRNSPNPQRLGEKFQFHVRSLEEEVPAWQPKGWVRRLKVGGE